MLHTACGAWQGGKGLVKSSSGPLVHSCAPGWGCPGQGCLCLLPKGLARASRLRSHLQAPFSLTRTLSSQPAGSLCSGRAGLSVPAAHRVRFPTGSQSVLFLLPGTFLLHDLPFAGSGFISKTTSSRKPFLVSLSGLQNYDVDDKSTLFYCFQNSSPFWN